jgi:HPt (histidine-containing phosphotransfer) domain-containing protein
VSWQDLGKEFQRLRAEFRGSMPAKVVRLRSLWARVAGEEPDPDALDILRRELHNMATSAGSFGLPQVATTAAAAERALLGLAPGEHPEPELIDLLSRLLQQLEVAALPPR